MKRFELFFTGLFMAFLSHAQMSGWNHIQPLLIQENSGSNVYDYQLSIIFDTQTPIASGEMNANGDDIRFTSACSGGTNFNYWIESGLNTSTTKIWVKIDSLQASAARTIYMQWGNASAGAVSNISSTFIGPHSATDSITGGATGGVTNSQRGIRFAANEDILVTAFGKNEPNGTTRYVTLFDFSTQAILMQNQVSGPAAQYSYGNLPSPIWLNQGTQYVLEMYQGSSDGYYYGPSTSQIGQHLTYLDMRYCNGCTQNTFPTSYLNNIHYGYPDLWYYTKKNVTPAPTYSFDSYQFSLVGDSINLCFSDSIELSLDIQGGQEPYSFSWTNVSISDATIQSPEVFTTTSMTYYVTVNDACGATETDSIYVDVKALPDFDIEVSNSLICNGENSELIAVGLYDYSWSTGETNDTVMVNPSATTTYSVTAINEFSCTATDSVQVTVNVPLTATHNVDICANESLQVGNHVYTIAGTYIDTLAGITACDSIVTNVLTVNVLPTATHSVSICFGTSLQVGNHTYSMEGTYVDTLSGFSGCDSIITTVLSIKDAIDAEIQQVGAYLVADFGADGYQWIDCNTNLPISGETQSSLPIPNNGSYACILTIDGCDQQSTCLVVDDLAVSEESDLSGISIYPNPANYTVSIYSGIDQVVTILDANGRELKAVELRMNETNTISLSGFASGVYFVRHGKFVSRLVVQ